MRIFTAIALAAMLSGLSVAHADGYVSLGVGSRASTSGDLAGRFHSEGISAGRLALGYRSGSLAIEAVAFGNGLGDMTSSADMATASLGLDLKYHLHIALGIEGYGRAGLHRTWLAQSGTPESLMSGYQGNGYVLGGGLQYGFELLPVVEAAIWADYSRQEFDLTDEAQQSMSGTADVITVGLSIGL
jgi:hypothetical protein